MVEVMHEWADGRMKRLIVDVEWDGGELNLDLTQDDILNMIGAVRKKGAVRAEWYPHAVRLFMGRQQIAIEDESAVDMLRTILLERAEDIGRRVLPTLKLVNN